MSETVPSVIASIDPGLLAEVLVVPNVVLDVVVRVPVVVVVDVVVVVVVDVLAIAIASDPAAVSIVRVRPPDLVQRDVNPGPDLEAEHPHEHREDRQRSPSLGAERGSFGGSRHRSVGSILPGERTLRKPRSGSTGVRATPTRGSARGRAHIFGDPRTRWTRSALEPRP